MPGHKEAMTESIRSRGAAGHFAEVVVGEVLGLAFFDSLQNQAGDEFRLVAIGVTGCGSATGRISHPVLAEIRRRDKWVDFADHNAILLQLGARRETESEKCALRRRIDTILRDGHESCAGIDVYNASAALGPHHGNHRLHCHDWR